MMTRRAATVQGLAMLSTACVGGRARVWNPLRPQAKGLLFEGTEGEVLLWRGAGAEIEVVAESMRPLSALCWAPVSNRFAVTAKKNGQGFRVFLAKVGAEPEICGPRFRYQLDRVEWSPDEKRIAVLERGINPGETRVHLIDVASGDAETITPKGSSDMDFSWSPDGTTLALVHVLSERREVNGCFLHSTQVKELELFDLASRKRKRLTNTGGSVEAVAWSPSGEHIAVQVGDALCLIDPRQGREDVLLSKELSCHGTPAWSPDGLHIAHTLDKPDNRDCSGIGIFSLDGELEETIGVHREEEHFWNWCWGPSAEEFCYVQANRLVVANLTNGSSRQVGTSTGSRAALSWM